MLFWLVLHKLDTSYRVIWEEGLSTKKMPLYYLHIGAQIFLMVDMGVPRPCHLLIGGCGVFKKADLAE